MMNFMGEGGFNMWVLLIGFFATVGYALARPKAERAGVFLAGTIFLLLSAILGMSTGMAAVARNYARFPNQVEALGTGLGELSNNGTFGAILALCTGAAALVSRRRAARP